MKRKKNISNFGKSKDVFENRSTIEYDEYNLLPVNARKWLNITNFLEIKAEYDYRILQANNITDSNDNITVFDFSPLGLLKATAHIGKGTQGDYKSSSGSFYNRYAPSGRMEYDFLAFMNDGNPVWVKTVQRERHWQDDPDPESPTIVTKEYSDGFGRLLQTRVQAEDMIFGGSTSSAPSRVATVRIGDTMGDVTPAVKYNLENNIYSSMVILDDTGAVVNTQEYYPFGETSFGSYGKKRYQYVGKERDEESGLYYYGARYYSPKYNLMLSVDQMYELYPSFSPYAYTLQNPVRYVDPTGMFVEDHEYSVDKQGNVRKEQHIEGSSSDNLHTKENWDKGNLSDGIEIKDQGIMSGLLKNRSNIKQAHHSSKQELGGIYTTSQNKDQMVDTFLFFSENTDVEWTLQGNGNERTFNIALGRLNNQSDQAINFTGVLDGFNENNLLFHYHNHSGTARHDLWPSANDIISAQNDLRKSPNAEIYIYMPQMSKENYNKVRPRLSSPINYEPSKFLKLDQNYLKWYGN